MSYHGPSQWSNSKSLALKKLVTEGLTASEIGNVLGCTRNAIIGKCARIGLTLLGNGRTRPKRAVAPPPAPTPAPIEKKEVVLKDDLADWTGTGGAAQAVAELGRDACRFPLGHPPAPGFHFCSQPVDLTRSTSYCARHHKLCHVRTFGTQ